MDKLPFLFPLKNSYVVGNSFFFYTLVHPVALLPTSLWLFLSLCLPYVSTVSTEGPPSCPKGCDRCSEYNGCIKCKPKLFIFLERNDIRQIGVCLASCPMGYFGMRNPEGNNRCTRKSWNWHKKHDVRICRFTYGALQPSHFSETLHSAVIKTSIFTFLNRVKLLCNSHSYL